MLPIVREKNCRAYCKACYNLLLVFLLLNCQKAHDVPSNILSKEKMTRILIDLHIAEAAVSEKNYLSPDSAWATFQALQKKILQNYRVDSIQYHQSYDYYLKDMHSLDEIYAAVVDSLSYRTAIGKLQAPFLEKAQKKRFKERSSTKHTEQSSE